MPFPATSGALERFRQLLFASASAGLLAGLFAALAHQIATVPLIRRAEFYEEMAEPRASIPERAASAVRGPAGGHDHGGVRMWAPGPGLERIAFTALTDLTTAFGFALLLSAALALRGEPTGWREGISWGIAGFAAFSLAPGLGLPPELPGTAAAPLADRQLWWLATAALTASGLACLFLARSAPAALAGVVLIALPQLHGAPEPSQPGALAPASLAHHFAEVATVVTFLFWVVLGGASGHFCSRWIADCGARTGMSTRRNAGAPLPL